MIKVLSLLEEVHRVVIHLLHPVVGEGNPVAEVLVQLRGDQPSDGFGWCHELGVGLSIWRRKDLLNDPTQDPHRC